MAEDLSNEFMLRIGRSPLPEIYAFIKKNSISKIMSIRGADNCTALHVLASNNRLHAAEFLIRFAKETYGESFSDEMEIWVNCTTNEDQMTCTHLAILRGNLDLVKLFINYGAKLDLVTRSGHTVMHLGAKSDQILILAWLRNQNLSAESKDKQDFTPLHYSSMMACELATAVLLSWKVPVNTVNINGQTALHLAVLSGSQRIIRSLLLRGADVDAKDKENKTALDLAREKGNTDIISLIEPPGILSVCGIKPPQRPIKFKSMLMVVYIFLLGFGFLSLVGILEIRSVGFLVFWVAETIVFIIACCKNPGYLKKNHTHRLLELASNSECFQICPECVTRRPPRSRHCQCCNKCVEKFDHHCPWINNCIGAKNLGIFYCFLIITFVFLLITGYECCYYVYTFGTTFKSIIAALWAGVAFGFTGPLFLLISVQTRNILTNTTTNERYSRKIEATAMERSDSDEQVERTSMCGNIIQMCCNTTQQEYKIKKSNLTTEGITRYSVIASDYNLKETLLNNNFD